MKRSLFCTIICLLSATIITGCQKDNEPTYDVSSNSADTIPSVVPTDDDTSSTSDMYGDYDNFIKNLGEYNILGRIDSISVYKVSNGLTYTKLLLSIEPDGKNIESPDYWGFCNSILIVVECDVTNDVNSQMFKVGNYIEFHGIIASCEQIQGALLEEDWHWIKKYGYSYKYSHGFELNVQMNCNIVGGEQPRNGYGWGYYIVSNFFFTNKIVKTCYNADSTQVDYLYTKSFSDVDVDGFDLYDYIETNKKSIKF